MHKSRLAGLLIDCDTDDLYATADFWAEAPVVSRDFDKKAHSWAT